MQRLQKLETHCPKPPDAARSCPKLPDAARMLPAGPRPCPNAGSPFGRPLPEAARSCPMLPDAARSGPKLPDAARSGPKLPDAARSGPKRPEAARRQICAAPHVSVSRVPEPCAKKNKQLLLTRAFSLCRDRSCAAIAGQMSFALEVLQRRLCVFAFVQWISVCAVRPCGTWRFTGHNK